MRLNDSLPKGIEANGKYYKVDFSFDNILDVLDVFSDITLDLESKIDIGVALLLDEEEPPLYEKVIIWEVFFTTFLKIEKRIKKDFKGNPMYSPSGEQLYEDEDDEQNMNISQDAEYIHASFFNAYKINLFEQQGKMHWLEFKSLLAGLPSDTIMRQVIQIRSWKPYKGVTNQERERMEKLQNYYKLEEVETDG